MTALLTSTKAMSKMPPRLDKIPLSRLKVWRLVQIRDATAIQKRALTPHKLASSVLEVKVKCMAIKPEAIPKSQNLAFLKVSKETKVVAFTVPTIPHETRI
jgi:hypothetical protein